MDDGERRCIASWGLFGWAARLAALGDEELIGLDVHNPNEFRENLEFLVSFMSDHMPCWVNIHPGEHVCGFCGYF